MFEREAFEVFINEVVASGRVKVEKAVRLNLKDYKSEDIHVDLVKVTRQDGLSLLLLSETLSY